MGRGLRDDPLFFHGVAAAALTAFDATLGKMPAAVAAPTRRPPARVARSTITVSMPGVIVTSAASTAKETRADDMLTSPSLDALGVRTRGP